MTKNELKRRQRIDLVTRLRNIREDMYGNDGAQFLADALEIPLQTWLNYESGVAVPAETILELIVTAAVRPEWLVTGQGAKYANS
jgi:hypothetical protein